MTPERIRIKVAEAIGWKRKPEFDYTSHQDPMFREHGERREMWGDDSGRLIPTSMLPNYPFDLNACAEFETSMTPDEFNDYREILYEICGAYSAIIATALQRCEAYLRVKGLWEETP